MALRLVRRAAGPLIAVALPLCIALLLSRSVSLRAADPPVRFYELMAGANGDSRIQFIEIAAASVRGTCWGPQVAPGTPGADSDDSLCYAGGDNETRSRNALVFFDRLGRETGRYKFPENPPGGGAIAGSRRNPGGASSGIAVFRSSSSSPNVVLVATEAFAQLPGAPAPHFVMPPLLNAIAGKVCFVGNTDENPNATPMNVCISYGPFEGDTEGGGAPAPALPLIDTVSLQRNGAGFSLSAAPTPATQSGGAFKMPVASQVAQGQTLFMQETFDGNGRTCGGCHPTADNGRLTPADIQRRFGDVGETFDSLFLSETSASGFDFGLNLLTIASRPTPSSGTDFLNASGGDLRGIVTSTNGARAKVLARKSATVYLVYAGISPPLSGTITDGFGNQAVVMSVSRGNLEGLELPRLMRTSRSAAFPQGRALILENIDGFDRPAVFRKSPHILNLSRTGPFGFNGAQADLQVFTLDAVRQHFPRTLARATEGPDPDFRMPTPDELSAMDAFQRAQEFPTGNDPNKFNLDRFVTTPAQQRGRNVFFGVGRCSFCHGGTVLATTTVNILGKGIGVNASFNTGVAAQGINAPNVDNLPCEPVGACNTREFSVPSLMNIRNLGPFFHDNSAATLRDAILFYSSAQFAQSPAGRNIGIIVLSTPSTDDLIAFLEAVSVPGGATLTSDGRSAATPPASPQPPSVRPAPSISRAVRSVTVRSADAVQFTATTVVHGLSDVTDIAIAPDGRVFMAERTGNIRLVREGQLLSAPVLSVPDFDARDGRGALTIAVDPEFSHTRLLYALYTASTGFQLARFRVRGDVAADRAVLIDRLGVPAPEPGAALRFGPDGALYVAVDDGGEARDAGNLGSFRGKVLRMNPDATTPRDQMGGSPVYAIDVNQPRALDWDAGGNLWVLEPRRVSAFVRNGDGSTRGVLSARVSLTDDVHAGMIVYPNTAIAELRGNLLVGAADGRGLLRLRPRSDGGPVLREGLFQGLIDGVRALASTEQGVVYVATADALIRVSTPSR